MADTDFPGYNIAAGTWDTDARLSTTTRTGPYSLEYVATTTTTSIVSDYIPVSTGQLYLANFIVRADSVAAGRTMTLYVQMYDINKSSTGSLSYALNGGVLASANVWHHYRAYVYTSSSARYVRFFANRSGANAFTAYLDAIEWDPVKVFANLYQKTAQTIAAGAGWTYPVEFDGDTYGSGYAYDPTGAYYSDVFHCDRVGNVRVDAAVTLDTAVTDKLNYIGLYSGSTLIRRGYADRTITDYPTVSLGLEVTVSKGDTLSIGVYNGDTSAVDTLPGRIYTYANFRYVD